MKKLLASAAIIVAATLPLSAQEPEVDAGTVLATVNGNDITVGHLVAMRARLPAEYQELPAQVLFDGMLEQLVQQQVLADVASDDMSSATRLGLENERRAFLAATYVEDVAMAEISDEELQAEYDAQYADADPVEDRFGRVVGSRPEGGVHRVERGARGGVFGGLRIGPGAALQARDQGAAGPEISP